MDDTSHIKRRNHMYDVTRDIMKKAEKDTIWFLTIFILHYAKTLMSMVKIKENNER